MDRIEDLEQKILKHKKNKLNIKGFRRAAVLVPILKTPTGLEILFTVRSEQLSSHAGQIAFPGGRLDEHETYTEAALRETSEEIGLNLTRAKTIGYLSEHPSPGKYIVRPVVAVIDWPQELKINSDEVSEVFTAPLEDLLKIETYTEERIFMDYRRYLHFFQYKDYLIWGLTGNVLKELLELIRNKDVKYSALFE
ncbi:MAG TPA: CoA pyrophosphatase [Trueperaceae bacterium]|nr:CoA pyrophosphatase [Trueperaceae bacterium]